MISIPGYILQVAAVGDMMMISQFYNREGRALDKLSFSSILLNCFNKNHSIYGIFGNLPHCWLPKAYSLQTYKYCESPRDNWSGWRRGVQCHRRQTHIGDGVTIQMLTNTFAEEVQTQRGGGRVVQAETNFEWDVVDRRDSGIWRLWKSKQTNHAL